MARNGWAALGLSAFSVMATAAAAADLPSVAPVGPAPAISSPPLFYLHLGPAGLILDESAKIKAGGQVLPGATISVKSQLTLGVEAGYFLTPNIAVSLTGGIPPIAKIVAAGSLDGYGTIGKATYGPAALTVHYHFLGLGALQPYVGVGPVLFYVFDDKDGIMSQLRVRNSFGVAFQAGADLMLNEHWGLFVDVKKTILRTEAAGFLGPVPIKANVTMDPLVLSGGATYRF